MFAENLWLESFLSYLTSDEGTSDLLNGDCRQRTKIRCALRNVSLVFGVLRSELILLRQKIEVMFLFEVLHKLGSVILSFHGRISDKYRHCI